MLKTIFTRRIKPGFEKDLEVIRSFGNDGRWLIPFLPQYKSIEPAYLVKLHFSIEAYMVKALEMHSLSVPLDDLQLTSHTSLPVPETDHADQLMPHLEAISQLMSNEKGYDNAELHGHLSEEILISNTGAFATHPEIDLCLEGLQSKLNGLNGNKTRPAEAFAFLTFGFCPEALLNTVRFASSQLLSIPDNIFTPLINAGYFTLTKDENAFQSTIKIAMTTKMQTAISQVINNGSLTSGASHAEDPILALVH